MRVVVVGASSGLGRELGVGLARRGARVALLGRRFDRLRAAAAEAGPGAVAVPGDVTDEGSIARGIETAADDLGGIDAMLYCAGTGVLRRVEDLDPETWQAVFATNVVGASQATRFALPHLQESGGSAAYLTTARAPAATTWPGLAASTVARSALEELIEAWRAEHPEVGFTRVVAGEPFGEHGDLIGAVDAVLRCGASATIPTVAVTARRAL